MNPYHKFLLKHRPKCEIGTCFHPATTIAKVGFRDTALCDAHARAYFPIETGLRERARLEQVCPNCGRNLLDCNGNCIFQEAK